MLSVAAVVAAALLWIGLLFGTALYAERHPGVFARHWRHVYALSLAVHCTSWTFYGTVTQAARSGWPLPPTFVGTIRPVIRLPASNTAKASGGNPATVAPSRSRTTTGTWRCEKLSLASAVS